MRRDGRAAGTRVSIASSSERRSAMNRTMRTTGVPDELLAGGRCRSFVSLLASPLRALRPTFDSAAAMRKTRARLRIVGCCVLAIAVAPASSDAQSPTRFERDTIGVQNASGLRLIVVAENDLPVLRIILPGHAASDRSIEVLFPEHVTAVRSGSRDAQQLYRYAPGSRGAPTAWRRSGRTLEFERDLREGVHLRARATLEDEGVRFTYTFTNRSKVAYDMIYGVTDPRLTGIFHDERLQRTWVHHATGFDLLASETPARLTMPRARWLPSRYLASFRWPVPPERVEQRGDAITYYNKSRAVDEPFIATRSQDGRWVVASVARDVGNVWSNPELTCQHVDPQAPLAAGQEVTLEVKLLVMRGSLEQALRRAREQRRALR